MGVKNYLIEGVSCAGKTTVCDELLRRGYHAVHGDRELAYAGNPDTGEPATPETPGEHIWDLDKVRAIVADHSHQATFFCGGSRNAHRFLDLFDAVFVLELDRPTLERRLAERPDCEWGGPADQGADFARLQHETGHGLPTNAISIDATAPLTNVVDTVLVLSASAAG
ncbi:MAG: AAA family ATPase [Planctomycetota bacterium]